MDTTKTNKWRAGWPAAVLALGLGLVTISGCTDPDKDIPAPEVTVVEAYGQKLDESATPQQVTYVLLKSMEDDIAAAQKGDREGQKAAMKTTFSLAAYSTIEQRLLEVMNLALKDKKTSLGPERNKQLYELTRGWASIVSYYIRSFPKDFAEAQVRMQALTTSDAAHIQMDLSHDPSDPSPPRYDTARLDVELKKEKGDKGTFWRVARVSYAGRIMPAQIIPATQFAPPPIPAAMTQPAAASAPGQ